MQPVSDESVATTTKFRGKTDWAKYLDGRWYQALPGVDYSNPTTFRCNAHAYVNGKRQTQWKCETRKNEVGILFRFVSKTGPERM